MTRVPPSDEDEDVHAAWVGGRDRDGDRNGDGDGEGWVRGFTGDGGCDGWVHGNHGQRWRDDPSPGESERCGGIHSDPEYRAKLQHAEAKRRERRLAMGIDPDAPPDPSEPEEGDIVATLLVKRTGREADRRLRVMTDTRPAIPTPMRLTEFLTETPTKRRWRIEGLWPAGGRVILAAPRKAGKSTLSGNLLRSLADGVLFLGQYPPATTGRRIVIIDNELDRDTLRRWLRDHDITDTSRITVWPLRGDVRSLDVLDPVRRAEWAAWLRDLDCGTLILDCLRPVLDAFGLDEDHDPGQFLAGWDELLADGGVDDSLLIHHMGHNGQRSRGSSRLRDWPDCEWKLLRADPDDDNSPRSFAAYGRDVNLPAVQLDYDPPTRRLTVAGSARAAEALQGARVVAEHVAKVPGVSGRGLESALKVELGRDGVRAALEAATAHGWIYAVPGQRGSHRHFPVRGQGVL